MAGTQVVSGAVSLCVVAWSSSSFERARIVGIFLSFYDNDSHFGSNWLEGGSNRLEGGSNCLEEGSNRFEGVRQLWEAWGKSGWVLVLAATMCSSTMCCMAGWYSGCDGYWVAECHPGLGFTPAEPDPPAVGLIRPQHHLDPASRHQGGQSIANGLLADPQVLSQAGVGRVTRGLAAGVFEQGGGEHDRGPVPFQPGVLAQGVRQGGEGELGLGSRVWARERTLPSSGPRDRGRRGETGCGAVHGRAPRPPARIRAWNVGAAPARAVRSSASRRARSAGVSRPQCGGASEEISVMGSDRPLHRFVGRLE
jgi:hypothetical protein